MNLKLNMVKTFPLTLVSSANFDMEEGEEVNEEEEEKEREKHVGI